MIGEAPGRRGVKKVAMLPAIRLSCGRHFASLGSIPSLLFAEKVPMKRTTLAILVALTAAGSFGCDHETTASAQSPAAAAAGKPAEMVKLSTFGYAGYCSLATAADGTLHAIYTDAKAYGKPHYVYYRTSKDEGATWTEPKNLSDDESGAGASWCQIKIDGSGRAYAIWKYIDENTALDGPGGNAGGQIAVRCLDGGAWSKTVRFGDEHQPSCSWFAANGPDGKVNLLWTQAQPDIDQKNRGMQPQIADNLSMATFDGGGAPKITPILVAKPLPTAAEIEAAHAAGKDLTFEQQTVQPDGLWNLRGFIADDGRPHFIGERYHSSSQDPTSIMRYDGRSLSKLYDYKGYLSYNTFNCPPALVRGADGKEHFVRKPEVSENEVIRDYVVDADGKPGDPIDVIAIAGDRTKIFNWHVSSLAGGRIAAMAALSPKGMYDDGDDLYVSIGDGKGKWSTPVNVTDNAGRATFFAKAAVSQSTSYQPTFAEAVTLKSGDVGILIVNSEYTISGLNTATITNSGTITGLSTSSTSSPYVVFTKVKG
jgi:hypothetical protein